MSCIHIQTNPHSSFLPTLGKKKNTRILFCILKTYYFLSNDIFKILIRIGNSEKAPKSPETLTLKIQNRWNVDSPHVKPTSGKVFWKRNIFGKLNIIKIKGCYVQISFFLITEIDLEMKRRGPGKTKSYKSYFSPWKNYTWKKCFERPYIKNLEKLRKASSN